MSKIKIAGADYSDMTQLVPGVFYNPGDSVYIVDDQGEVCSWNADEWNEDFESITAAIALVALAASKGPAAVRESIAKKGAPLIRLIEETFERTELTPSN